MGGKPQTPPRVTQPRQPTPPPDTPTHPCPLERSESKDPRLLFTPSAAGCPTLFRALCGKGGLAGRPSMASATRAAWVGNHKPPPARPHVNTPNLHPPPNPLKTKRKFPDGERLPFTSQPCTDSQPMERKPQICRGRTHRTLLPLHLRMDNRATRSRRLFQVSARTTQEQPRLSHTSPDPNAQKRSAHPGSRGTLCGNSPG